MTVTYPPNSHPTQWHHRFAFFDASSLANPASIAFTAFFAAASDRTFTAFLRPLWSMKIYHTPESFTFSLTLTPISALLSDCAISPLSVFPASHTVTHIGNPKPAFTDLDGHPSLLSDQRQLCFAFSGRITHPSG